MTPVTGEVVVNTTDKRPHLGDGATAGGIPLPNATDVQQQAFAYAAVGGTGNAITLTNAASPVTAYAAPLRQVFKAGASNSGAVTVDVDGRGTKNIKKMDNGTLAALVTGDIISGGIYEISYDGTQFQIMSAGLSNSGVTAGTYTNPSSVVVDAKGRVTSISSGTGATMTALAVGSIILASASATVAADGTTSASNLTIRALNNSTGLINGSDSLSGTWKALQSVNNSTIVGGLWQRTV
jgi:hypothetical protein